MNFIYYVFFINLLYLYVVFGICNLLEILLYFFFYIFYLLNFIKNIINLRFIICCYIYNYYLLYVELELKYYFLCINNLMNLIIKFI